MSTQLKVGKVPPHMLESLPAEKIPELLESRDGHNSLIEHLRSIKAWIDIVYNSIPKNGITDVASIIEKNLPDIAWHDVITYTPTISSNYLIYLYIRVNESDTNLNLVLEYADAGGLQTKIILSNFIQAKGSYSITPVFVNTIANYPIKIKAISGKPNQTFISANLIGL